MTVTHGLAVDIHAFLRSIDREFPPSSLHFPWDGYMLTCEFTKGVCFGISAAPPDEQKGYRIIPRMRDEDDTLLEHLEVHLVIPEEFHIRFDAKQCTLHDGGDMCWCAGTTWFRAPPLLVNRSNVEHQPTVWNQCGLIVMRFNDRLWIKVRDRQQENM